MREILCVGRREIGDNRSSRKFQKTLPNRTQPHGPSSRTESFHINTTSAQERANRERRAAVLRRARRQLLLRLREQCRVARQRKVNPAAAAAQLIEAAVVPATVNDEDYDEED